MKQTIVFAGQFMDFSGYAWAGRAYAKMFKEKFPNVLFCDISIEKRTKGMSNTQIFEYKKTLKIEDIEFVDIDVLNRLTGEVIYFECFIPSVNVVQYIYNINHPTDVLNKNANINLKKVSMVAWESNKIGDMFMKGLHDCKFDHVVFHTDEHLTELQEQIGIPCSWNHYPVMELFEPSERKKREDNQFRILSFNDFQPRKDWKTLLSSYYSTFFDHDDVVLRIKTHGDTERIHTLIKELKEMHSNTIFTKNKLGKYDVSKQHPKCKIELDVNFLTEHEISSYYSNFDLFACTTKGEGFGLTIAQAGLSGMPVLCPERGGHRYFVPDISYMPETFTSAIERLPIEFYTGKTMYLYQCDYLSTKHQLKAAYDDWKSNSLKRKGLETKKFMENVLSTDKCFNNILKVMEELK